MATTLDDLPEAERTLTEGKEKTVQRMFSSIAKSYDLNNTLMSFGLHHGWKQAAVDLAGPAKGDRAIDIGAGTADMAILLARKVGESGHVIALDLNRNMLEVGKKKVERMGLTKRVTCLLGNAEDLQFRDASFDVATTAFCLRNVVDIGQAFREMSRVLVRGGRAVCLEFSLPHRPLLKWLYDLYSYTILPLTATAVSGDRTGVYYYLPDSIRRFHDPEQVREVMEEAGFREVSYAQLSGGIVAIHRGIK